MKTIKLLSTFAIIAFTSYQVNAQITPPISGNGVNIGIGNPAPIIGLGNSKNNIRLDINGAVDSGFTGHNTAQRYFSGSIYGATQSTTSGYLGYNYNTGGASSTLGVSANLRITTARASGTTSRNHGGHFTTDIGALSGSKRFEIAGTYGSLSGSWNGIFNGTSLINKSYAGAVVGIDQIKGEHTFGGYFEGRGYFSDNVGIGTDSPASKLHVKNIGATNPAGASGGWAAKIENNVDTPNENGLFVANRWGLNTSTIFEAGSFWNGTGEAYTPVLTVKGNRKVGIGTNNPASELHVVGESYLNGNTDVSGTFRVQSNAFFSQNIGMGTTMPQSKLHINNGDLRINNGDLKVNDGVIRLTGTNFAGGPMILFGENGLTPDNGQWGIEYVPLANSTKPGLNFWRPSPNANSGNYYLFLSDTGKVAVGTNNTPTNVNGADTSAYHLFVKGGMLTEEVRVRTGWADYVFADDYNLKPLAEVESFIKENKHLPNVPSAKTVEEQGIELGDISRIQQEKIEELMLYIIQQEKRIKALEDKIKE